MVTVVYKVIVKNGSIEAFRDVALKCEEIAHGSNECVYYTFFQALTNPKEFIVSYRFASKKAQDEHIKKLQKIIGPASEGRDLPTKFTELVESDDIVLFEVSG